MKFGRYEVDKEVGRGGMGVVYRAHSPEGRAVAIKAVRDKDGRNTLARFDRERRLANELVEDDGFVPLLDAGVSDEGPFLVMPFLEGGTLRDKLGHAWSVEETLQLGRALARALGRAHQHGIVHRDLKPENILFTGGTGARSSPTGSGKPLITDLGLAKHFRTDGARSTIALTAIGHMVGTAGYMAPEQIHEAKNAGPAADVFALGLILHECLTGKPAFSGKNPADLLANIAEGNLAPLREVRRDAPDELLTAIERATARKPEERFADGDAFARALLAPMKTRAGAGWGSIVAVCAIVGGLAFLALTGDRGAPPANGAGDTAHVDSSAAPPAPDAGNK